jgi:hypothetical protein
MSRLALNRPRGYSLLLIRRRAQAGLLRDGGMTAAQVCCYFQELRCEVELEVALRIHKLAQAETRPSGSTEDC